MNRYNMIKGSLHLPFSQKSSCSESLASMFWSLVSVALASPQLLVFDANGPLFFYSQQPSKIDNTNNTTKNNRHQTKETLEKSALNGMAHLV